jgi:hypothetical protein
MLIFVLGFIFPGFSASLPNRQRAAMQELVSSMSKIANELLQRAEKEKTMGIEVDKSILGVLGA